MIGDMSHGEYAGNVEVLGSMIEDRRVHQAAGCTAGVHGRGVHGGVCRRDQRGRQLVDADLVDAHGQIAGLEQKVAALLAELTVMEEPE
jgi:hypothetical protein